ncbi:hypothetical protein TeGR_g5878, partial [Tetraparma gracilis]
YRFERSGTKVDAELRDVKSSPPAIVHLTAEQRAIVDGCKTLEGASAARRSFLERSLKTTSSFMGAPKDDDVAGWEVLPSPSNFVKMWRRIQADTDSTKVALGKAEAIIDVEAGAALKWYNTPCNNERTLGSLEEGDLARFVLKDVTTSRLASVLLGMDGFRKAFERDEEIDKIDRDKKAAVIVADNEAYSEEELQVLHNVTTSIKSLSEEKFEVLESPDFLVRMSVCMDENDLKEGGSGGCLRATAIIDTSIEQILAHDILTNNRYALKNQAFKQRSRTLQWINEHHRHMSSFLSRVTDCQQYFLEQRKMEQYDNTSMIELFDLHPWFEEVVLAISEEVSAKSGNNLGLPD